MAVKHLKTDIIHKGFKGGKTGCGADTTTLPSHWENTSEKVNCTKIGCK